ncbi:MAG: thioredoxin-dependent thiol peroxidase [Moraxellaceae bacterium]|nr:MAG: thioredoxin-dependent thiol peroxidase [Moraxellaceae bacterium]
MEFCVTLQIGTPVPTFCLPDQNAESVSAGHFLGRWLVIYFYPKASTPGCTVQACGLRDSFAQLASLDAQVVGISPDSPAKLKKFALAQSLPFTLLSDESHEVAEAYGVWALKKFMGKTFMGVVRTTFVVDPKGNLASILEGFKTTNHHEVVMAKVKQLQDIQNQ